MDNPKKKINPNKSSGCDTPDSTCLKFYNYTGAWSHIVTIISIFLAGAWTLSTFDVLNQVDKAKAELKEINERIKNTDSSSIDIKVERVSNVNSKSEPFGLIINVELLNTGRSKLEFVLANDSLTVNKVYAEGDKVASELKLHPKYYTQLGSKLNGEVVDKSKVDQPKKQVKVILLSGSKKILPYFVALKEPGLYYVSFKSDIVGNISNVTDEYPQSDQGNSKNKRSKPVKWFSARYFEVK